MPKRRVRKAAKISRRKLEKIDKRVISAESRRIRIALRNFLLFLALTVLSYIPYKILVTTNSGFLQLFSLLTIIFSFVSVALLIVLMIFLILRASREFKLQEEEMQDIRHRKLARARNARVHHRRPARRKRRR